MSDLKDMSNTNENIGPSAEEMEQKLAFVESLFIKYGATPAKMSDKNRKKFGRRETFMYKGMYYRVDSLTFHEGEAPFIVISCTDEDKFAGVGLMEDVGAFGFDLGEEEIEKEVRFALDVEL